MSALEFAGVNVRDYFAAHAPAEVPDWFVHVEPHLAYPPMPNYLDLDESHRELVRNWQCDPVFDLPDELAWFQDKVVAHRAGREAWREADKRARFVQWRWAYADMMLEVRLP